MWLFLLGGTSAFVAQRSSTSVALRRPAICRRHACSPVLGVPGFIKWIDGQVPATPVGEAFDAADVVAFDLNAVLHATLRKAFDEEHAITLMFSRLHATLRLLPPGATVVLALDGPAPVAKISTQRSRRLKAQKRDAKIAEAVASGSSRGKQRGISSLTATPGTQFMKKLEAALVYFVCSELLTHRARGLSFLVSGADAAGEGEIKLLGALHHTLRPRGPPRRRTAVLVGSDGDLLLQALAVDAALWDVCVLRELPGKGEAAEVLRVHELCKTFGLRLTGGGAGAAATEAKAGTKAEGGGRGGSGNGGGGGSYGGGGGGGGGDRSCYNCGCVCGCC